MSVNFFDTACQEPPRNDSQFGICDDQNGAKAYTDSTNQDRWIATVENNNKQAITFTAIDNCIIVLQPGTTDKESTCDGMLTFDNSLYLVELKDQLKAWLPKAKEQLENTIQLLHQHNSSELSQYTFKKAFACNKHHRRFVVIDNEEQKKLFDTTKFRLHVEATIKIK